LRLSPKDSIPLSFLLFLKINDFDKSVVAKPAEKEAEEKDKEEEERAKAMEEYSKRVRPKFYE
jgi:hypothetical protein